MLVLPIKKKWFDMICSGEKKEEYREGKPEWGAVPGKAYYILDIIEISTSETEGTK